LGLYGTLSLHPVIAEGGYNRDEAENEIISGKADLVSFGTAFLANPDLPDRFRRNVPLNEPDRSTFYTNGSQGYIDYPFYSDISSTVSSSG